MKTEKLEKQLEIIEGRPIREEEKIKLLLKLRKKAQRIAKKYDRITDVLDWLEDNGDRSNFVKVALPLAFSFPIIAAIICATTGLDGFAIGVAGSLTLFSLLGVIIGTNFETKNKESIFDLLADKPIDSYFDARKIEQKINSALIKLGYTDKHTKELEEELKQSAGDIQGVTL